MNSVLTKYITTGNYTEITRYHSLLDQIPGDIEEIYNLVRKVIVHPAKSDLEDTEQNRVEQFSKESTILTINDLLDDKLILTGLEQYIKNEKSISRGIYSCPFISLLLCSIARYKKIPCRMRVGFSYSVFPENPHPSQHWICEFYSSLLKRWVLIDADEGEFDIPGKSFIKSNVFLLDQLSEDNNTSMKVYAFKVFIHDLDCLFNKEFLHKNTDNETMTEVFQMQNEDKMKEILSACEHIEENFKILSEYYKRIVNN